MTVESRNAWNDILRACADMKELAEQIFEYANEWAENDTSVDEDEDEDTDKEDDPDFDLEDAIREHTAAIAELLKKKAGKSEVSFTITAK